MLKKNFIRLLAAVLVVYLGSYLAVRWSYSEVWDRDGMTYVLFPSSVVYYLYRPLMYIDSSVTGMRFHIGPHQ